MRHLVLDADISFVGPSFKINVINDESGLLIKYSGEPPKIAELKRLIRFKKNWLSAYRILTPLVLFINQKKVATYRDQKLQIIRWKYILSFFFRSLFKF